MSDTDAVRWACPKCGAEPDKHGRGGLVACADTMACRGFLCECMENGVYDTDDAGHGESITDPCRWATCYHCGWGGTFPPRPKKLPLWAKRALDAGWSPPKGWAP